MPNRIYALATPLSFCHTMLYVSSVETIRRGALPLHGLVRCIRFRNSASYSRSCVAVSPHLWLWPGQLCAYLLLALPRARRACCQRKLALCASLLRLSRLWLCWQNSLSHMYLWSARACYACVSAHTHACRVENKSAFREIAA